MTPMGYSFRGKYRYPRAKSRRKFNDRIRELTPRKSGESLEFMLRRINRATQGWFNYFRHCDGNIFRICDGMIRRRLRRNQRWPNAYFAEHGFISLSEAHVRFVQSTGTY